MPERGSAEALFWKALLVGGGQIGRASWRVGGEVAGVQSWALPLRPPPVAHPPARGPPAEWRRPDPARSCSPRPPRHSPEAAVSRDRVTPGGDDARAWLGGGVVLESAPGRRRPDRKSVVEGRW